MTTTDDREHVRRDLLALAGYENVVPLFTIDWLLGLLPADNVSILLRTRNGAFAVTLTIDDVTYTTQYGERYEDALALAVRDYLRAKGAA